MDCQYDGGDCCAKSCVSGAFDCGSAGYSCADPNAMCYTPGHATELPSGECLLCDHGTFDAMGSVVGLRPPWNCSPCPIGMFSNGSSSGAISEEEACSGTCSTDNGEVWLPSEFLGARSFAEACEPVCESGRYRGDRSASFFVQKVSYDAGEAAKLVDVPTGGVAAMSPDGKHMYFVAYDGSALLIFSVVDQLTYLGDIQPSRGDSGDLPFGILRGAKAMVVSGDGRHVYALMRPYIDGSILAFHRDAISGRLYFISQLMEGFDSSGTFVDGLEGAASLTMSPCGRHVYVAASSENAISVFVRDPSTGTLTYLTTLRNGATSNDGERIEGLEDVLDTAISPDGRHLYTVSRTALSIFQHNGTTSLLTYLGTNNFNGNRFPSELVMGPDGKFIFVAALGEGALGAVLAFARDAHTGLLTFNNVLEDIETQLTTVESGLRLYSIYCAAVSPDNRHLLLSASANSSTAKVIYVISINEVTAALAVEARFSDDGEDKDVHSPGTPAGSIVFDVEGDEMIVTPFWHGISTFTTPSAAGKLTHVDTLLQRPVEVVPRKAVHGVRSISVSPCGRHVYVVALSSSSLSVFERKSLTGDLTFVHSINDVDDGIESLYGPRDVTTSPDGNHVYVVSHRDTRVNGRLPSAILTFARDKRTGSLTFFAQIKAGDENDRRTVNGLEGPASVAVSPDGKHVYVASWSDEAVSCFARNTATGALSYVEAIREGETYSNVTVDGLADASSVVVSSDGGHVYVASPGDDAVSFFQRNSSTGALAFRGLLKNGDVSADGRETIGLDGATSLVLSPEGSHLYVAAKSAGAIAVLGRDANSGALEYLFSVHEGENSNPRQFVAGLSGVGYITISPDGSFVYSSACLSNAVATFKRDVNSGSLTFVEAVHGGNPLCDAACHWGLSVSPDSRTLYISDQNADVLVVVGSFGECSSCPAGHYCEEGYTTEKECTPGKYQPETGQSFCVACDVGRFQSASGRVSCDVCEIGYYAPVASEGCTSCPNGTYSSKLHIGSIDDCKACSPGRIATVNDGEASTSCRLCPAGKYSNEELTECLSCPAGRFSESVGITRMHDCIACPPGRYGIGGVQNATREEQSCEDCPGGRFRNFDGQECLQCVPGRASQPGAAECDFCPSGQHSNGNGTACRSCREGHVCIGGNEEQCPENMVPSPEQTYCVDCHGCPAGTFLVRGCALAGNVSESVCTACAAGRYQSLPSHHERQCDECPSNAYCGTGASFAGLCAKGTYLRTRTRDHLVAVGEEDALLFEEEACVRCKSGMQCSERGMVLEAIALRQGYYRSRPTSEDVLQCQSQDACLGGNATGDAICRTGHSGPYCAVCESGYFKLITYECVGCVSTEALSSVIGTCLLILGMITLLGVGCAFSPPRVETWEIESEASDTQEITLSSEELVVPGCVSPCLGGESLNVQRSRNAFEQYQSLKSRLRILFSLVQLELLSIVCFDLFTPAILEDILIFFDVVRLRVMLSAIGTCASNSLDVDVDFYDEVIAVTLVPLLLVLVLQMVKKIADDQKTGFFIDYACLLVTFLVFTPVAVLLCDVFVCETLETDREGEEQAFLMADYTVQCWTPLHNRFMVYAVVMILVYPLGIPLLYAWLLLRPSKAPLNLSVAQIFYWLKRVKDEAKKTESSEVGEDAEGSKRRRHGEDQRDLLAYANPNTLERVADTLHRRDYQRGGSNREATMCCSKWLLTAAHFITLGGLRRDRPLWVKGEPRNPRPENFVHIAEIIRNHVEQSTFLTESYQASVYYFELLECLRRLLIPVLAAGFDRRRDSTSVVGLLASVGFLMVYATMKPFRVEADSYVAMVAQLAICILFLANVAERSSHYGDRELGDNCAVFLLVFNLAVVIAVLVALLHSCTCGMNIAGSKTDSDSAAFQGAANSGAVITQDDSDTTGSVNKVMDGDDVRNPPDESTEAPTSAWSSSLETSTEQEAVEVVHLLRPETSPRSQESGSHGDWQLVSISQRDANASPKPRRVLVPLDVIVEGPPPSTDSICDEKS